MLPDASTLPIPPSMLTAVEFSTCHDRVTGPGRSRLVRSTAKRTMTGDGACDTATVIVEFVFPDGAEAWIVYAVVRDGCTVVPPFAGNCESGVKEGSSADIAIVFALSTFQDSVTGSPSCT